MFIPIPFIYGSSYQKSPEELKADADFRAFKQQLKNEKFEKKLRGEFCEFLRTKGFIPILKCNYGVRFISTTYPNLWGEYNNHEIILNWYSQGVQCNYRINEFEFKQYHDVAVSKIVCEVSTNGMLGEVVKPDVLYFRLPHDNISINFDRGNLVDVKIITDIIHNPSYGEFIWVTVTNQPNSDNTCINTFPVQHKIVFDNTMCMLAHGFIGDLNNMDLNSYDI